MRVIRIVEMPAIDAARVRFVTWWEGLSPRERVLVGILATLLALAVLVFGVVRPLQAARAQALADIRTYETLNARILAAGTLGPQVPQRTGPAIGILTQSAAGFGLTVQVEAVPGGARATIADAPYDAVMNWLADVARTSNLRATRVGLARTAAPGRVTGVVEFGE